MRDDWWPKRLEHIADEEPWAGEYVTVAELKSFDEQPYPGQRGTYSALVPHDQIEVVREKLSEFAGLPDCNGPWPAYYPGSAYKPEFWVECGVGPRTKFESLILMWNSHHSTVLQIDPGFLMTYGLVPRTTKEGVVHWDDPQAPRHDIAIVGPPSIWKASRGSEAYVKIRRDFLQDYLTLRGMCLVQVYVEERWGELDEDLEQYLNGESGREVVLSDRRYHISCYHADPKIVYTEVLGARIVASPGGLPVSDGSPISEGLLWPGIESPVSKVSARSFKPNDWVYVDDAVLGEFEGHSEFRISPESGAVKFGTQWTVAFCDRVGRNLIRLEIKKLYEGAPGAIVRHWHKFAVEPPSDTAYFKLIEEPHIGKRAKEIAYSVAELGSALRTLAVPNKEDGANAVYVKLRRKDLDFNGWWTFPELELIGRVVPLKLSSDGFLDRCLRLAKVVVEGLNEGNLRRLLTSLGVPSTEIKGLKALKLLDLIVRMSRFSWSTGLNIGQDGAQIWLRLSEDDIEPGQPISKLFALNDLRNLQAHPASERHRELTEILDSRFAIAPGETAAGYGRALDAIYDQVAEQIRAGAKLIDGVAP